MDKFRIQISVGVTLLALIFWFATGGRILASIPFIIGIFGLCYMAGRWRFALFLLFLAYQLGALGFTYLVDGHLDLLGLLKYIPAFKYIAFIGFVMIVLDITWHFIDWKSNKREKKELKDENTTLKAKLYDLQEASRKEDETGKS